MTPASHSMLSGLASWPSIAADCSSSRPPTTFPSPTTHVRCAACRLRGGSSGFAVLRGHPVLQTQTAMLDMLYESRCCLPQLSIEGHVRAFRRHLERRQAALHSPGVASASTMERHLNDALMQYGLMRKFLDDPCSYGVHLHGRKGIRSCPICAHLHFKTGAAKGPAFLAGMAGLAHLYFDGNFRLPHIAAQGHAAAADSLAGQSYMIPDSRVREFISLPAVTTQAEGIEPCNDFDADAALGRARSQQFDITGVAAALCRHSFVFLDGLGARQWQTTDATAPT